MPKKVKSLQIRETHAFSITSIIDATSELLRSNEPKSLLPSPRHAVRMMLNNLAYEFGEASRQIVSDELALQAQGTQPG